MTLEQSQYIEIESSLSDDEDAHITAGEPIPVGSGLLYAQQMLQETLTMTRRGRTERPASARVRYGISSAALFPEVVDAH